MRTELEHLFSTSSYKEVQAVLTQRQLQLLNFIHDYYQEKGVSPSFDEMRRSMKLKSKSGIHRLVSSLEERGFIKRLAYRARAVELLKPPPNLASRSQPSATTATETTVDQSPSGNIVRGNFRKTSKPREVQLSRLPLFGKIAAGTPIEALTDNNSDVEVPAMMLGDGEHYVLQVEGDSMIEAGIMSGDLAVIQRSDTAPNGTIVVALVDGHEATLKRLRQRGASIALEPANAAYETRIFGPHQVEVQGRLVGLLRCY